LGAGFSIGTKGYIGTGGDFTTFYKDFWEYDPSIITGIEEATKENIFVYPNPSSGKFKIKNIELQMTNYKFEIYNLLGGKIYSNSKFNQPTSNEIDLSNSPKGIYFVKIYNGEKFYTEKIVIL
jgi:Secretion system C-terminal sorting domain